MSSWSKLLMGSLFIFFLLPVSSFCVNASSDNLVNSSLTEAEDAFASTYEIVLDAERAGANVSGLFVRLNLCAKYLSEAHVWHRLGDSANANHFAGLCYDLVEDLRPEAIELRDEAKKLDDAKNATTTFGSVVAVIVVIVSCFVVWRIFKRRYNRQVLSLRPEVVSDGS